MTFSAFFASNRTVGLCQTADDKIDNPLHALFRTNYASDSMLSNWKVNGEVPARKIWNWEQAADRLAGATDPKSKVTFGLKTEPARDWRMARNDAKKRAKGIDPMAPEPIDISKQRASLCVDHRFAQLGDIPDSEKPLKRADKYYQALLKAEKARSEHDKKREWDEFMAKASRAAEKAKAAALKAEEKARGHHVDSDSDHEPDPDLTLVEQDDADSDCGPLQPYPGVMKVEVEVVVLRAPGADKSETDSSVDKDSTHTPSEASEHSEEDDDAFDWQKELQELQEEFAEPEKAEESETDSLPDGLFGKAIGNVHDSHNKRTALGLGGTAFFVPEVERYAFQPSLLPPPPRGEGHLEQTGHKRLKLKPRLPLEVSRHRWRDEHPYGCPVELEYSPDIDRLHDFEEKVRRVELYGTLTNIMRTMPKPDGIRKIPKTDLFERSLDYQLKDSIAWQQYIKRNRLMQLAQKNRDDKKTDGGLAQGMLAGYKPGTPSKKKDKKTDPLQATAFMKPDTAGSASGRPETGAYAKLPVSIPMLDETRGDYICLPPDRGKQCEACEGKGFWHSTKEGMSHDTEWNVKCLFCKTCKSCKGRGKHAAAKMKEASHIVQVPPLKIPINENGPSFQVGKMVPLSPPRSRSPSPAKTSTMSSPPKSSTMSSAPKSSLMSVAGGVRKGAQ